MIKTQTTNVAPCGRLLWRERYFSPRMEKEGEVRVFGLKPGIADGVALFHNDDTLFAVAVAP